MSYWVAKSSVKLQACNFPNAGVLIWWGEHWHTQPQRCTVTHSSASRTSVHQLTKEELTGTADKRSSTVWFFFLNLVDWHFATCSLRGIYSDRSLLLLRTLLWKVLGTVETFCAESLFSEKHAFKISDGFSFLELNHLRKKNQEWKNMKIKIKHCSSPKYKYF